LLLRLLPPAEGWRWSRARQHHAKPATVDAAPPTPVTLVEMSRTIIPMPKGVPSAHASALAQLPQGDLISFWWAGSRESGPDVKVYASRWSNGQWSDNWVVASRDSLGKALGHGVRRIGNPVAWTAADGTAHMWWPPAWRLGRLARGAAGIARRRPQLQSAPRAADVAGV
jgi:hypothetical protein